MGRKIAQKERSQGYMTLGEFIDPNRSILIRRNFGGAGDILMQRPIFDEIKRRNKLVQVHYTLPRKYIPLVQDLDSIDKIIPLEELGDIEERYNWKKDISTACIQHENTYGRNVFRQRTDIWADHLGIEVTEHGTLFQFTEKEIKEAREAIVRVAGTVDSLFFISPRSIDSRRNLTPSMVQAGVSWAQKHSLKPVLVHHEPIEEYSHLLTLSGLSLRVWMASMTFPSVMLTTDSAPLHIAGYMNVPTAAMFNYTSGNVVPKWYPTVVPFDLHRNRPGGLACSPCYHWSNCHYLKQDGLMPLKCVRDITDEQVVDALDKAWDLEKKPYNYSVYDGFDVDNKIIRLDGGMPKPQDSPTPKTKMDVLVLTIQDKSDEQAIIACVIATSVRNVFEKLKIITSPITDNQEKIIKACPYLSVSKINDVGVDYFVEIKLSDAIGHRNGWWAYVSNIVGCSTSVTAVFSSSTSVVNRMWDSFGDRLISFCDEGLVIDNTPVEDIVYDNEYLSWDERIAIIRIASKVVTSKPAIAMIGSLVGVDTTYKGDPKDVTGFDRMVIL